MARMPGAEWRPIPVNYTENGQESVRGVVVHIMDGSFEGTDSWFRNSKAQASSHFGTSRTGQLRQWVDTANRAWAQAGGNRTWLSVENEGKGGDVLTDEQIDRNAEVLAWAHKTYGVPLQLATSPDGRGLGYHAMGGQDWGGHTSCPGSRIVAQLPQIVSRARRLITSTPEEDDMTPEQAKQLSDLRKQVADLHKVLYPYAGWGYKGKNEPRDAYAYLRDTSGAVKSLTAQVGALTATVGKLAAGGGLDAAEIKAAAEAGAQAALDKLADALKDA